MAGATHGRLLLVLLVSLALHSRVSAFDLILYLCILGLALPCRFAAIIFIRGHRVALLMLLLRALALVASTSLCS